MRPGSRSSRAGTTTTSSGLTARTGSSTGCSRSRCSSGLAPMLLRQRQHRDLDRRRRLRALDRLVDLGRDGGGDVLEQLLRPLLRRAPEAARTGSTRRPAARPSVYIGQKIADPNGIWSMEFWNRNVRHVWSLDGTAPGPGPGPHARPDRDRRPARRRSRLRVRRHRHRPRDRRDDASPQQGATAPRSDREAAPAAESLAGVFSDGWIGSKVPADSVIADYNQFDAPEKPGDGLRDAVPEGLLRATRPGARSDRGRHDRPRTAEGRDPRPRHASERGWTIDSCAERTFPIETPGGPFHVKVTITPPFQPSTRRSRGTSSGATSAPSSASRSSRRRADQRPRPTSASGCLRANRAMPRRCQRVWRERNFLSITAA